MLCNLGNSNLLSDLLYQVCFKSYSLNKRAQILDSLPKQQYVLIKVRVDIYVTLYMLPTLGIPNQVSEWL